MVRPNLSADLVNIGGNMVLVRYRYWWPGFDPETSIVHQLLIRAAGTPLKISDDNAQVVDLEVQSVFGEGRYWRRIKDHLDKRFGGAGQELNATLRTNYGIHEKGRAVKHAWYSGENLRPPWDRDLTLSFEAISGIPGNIYLPHWVIRLHDLRVDLRPSGFSMSNSVLTRRRDPTGTRDGFACVIASNPHPMRFLLASELGRIGTVEGFGRAFKRTIGSKKEVLQRFVFALVPENDLYPGYVTEKAFDAWMAGCIPIWWGDDPLGYLNPEAMINVAHMDIPEIVDRVADVYQDKEELARISSAPILRKPFDFDSCIHQIRKNLFE